MQSADVLRAGAGSPLLPTLRADMEQRFGQDFSRVRIHSGEAAARAARDVNAEAYTVGHDIVFAAGRFAPGTRQGRRLIAHELTHVVQQSGAAGIGTGTKLVQRQPSPSTQTAADYEQKVKAGTWCRDSEETGRLHDPRFQCYREIPTGGDYSGGGQVCFHKDTGKFAEDSPDFVSAVSGRNPDGTCDIPIGLKDPPHPFSKRGRRALGHGIADVCAEDPKLCGRIYGGLSGVAMGIALPSESALAPLLISPILGAFGGLLAGHALPKLDRFARRHGFLPTLSLGFGSNVGLAIGTGFEKRDRPLPYVPVNTYLTFNLDSSLALEGESALLAKVGVRIDPGKQGGVFALGSLGAGVAMGSTDVRGTASGELGLGYRATDFLDVQVVRETLTGGESGGTYWVTLKLVAPRRVLEGH